MAMRDFVEVMKEAITAIAPGLENVGPQVSAERVWSLVHRELRGNSV
jgi:hypothetical protein